MRNSIPKRLSDKISSFALFCAAMVVGIHVAGFQEHGTVMWWWSRIGHFGCFLIAVPFFFAASGFFLAGHFKEEGWWKRECLKRTQSLLVPYVIWSGVAVLMVLGMVLAANVLHGRELSANIPSSWKWWALAFGMNPFCYPAVVPFWYLRTLMMFVVISPLLYQAIKWGGARILVVIYVASGAILVFAGGRFYLFMRYTFSLNGLFFFVLGMVMRLGECTLESRNRLLPLASLFFGIVALGCSILFCEVETRLFSLLRMVYVPLFLFAMWNLLPSVKLPRWLSSAAFPIYLLHVLVWRLLGAIEMAAHRHCFVFLRPEDFYGWGIKWIVGFGGSLMLALLLRRKLPRFASIAFGGR